MRPTELARKKRAPPTDRGELHIGGVAVFTRPFSGLLTILTHPVLGSFALLKIVFGIGQALLRSTLSRKEDIGDSAPKETGHVMNQPGYGLYRKRNVIRTSGGDLRESRVFTVLIELSSVDAGRSGL
jgi:hypothetical protein